MKNRQAQGPILSPDEIVAGLRQDDDAALAAFQARYLDRLVRIAGRWVSQDDATEVANDVIYEAKCDIADFDSARASFSTWLFVRCRNRAIDRARKVRRESLLVMAYSQEFAQYLTEPDPYAQVEASFDLSSFWNELPRQERSVVALHFLYGLTYEEVSRRMNISVETARTYAKRARHRLRRSD